MLTKKLYRGVAGLALIGLTAFATACDDFLDVPNPNNLEAEAIDEERDRTILSQSAYQTLVSNFGWIAVYQAWFTNEAYVGDTFPTRNHFGRRDIPVDGAENADRWGDLFGPIMQAENTIRKIAPAGNNLDLARAYFTAGYALLLLGESFCQGTLPLDDLVPGNVLTSAQTIDSAIVRLTKAREVAGTLTGADATNIATASLVGIARGHLQNGRKAEASQAAGQVPANFTYNFLYLDDASNRGRLGNDIWMFSESRISLVVGDEFRAMVAEGDTRISFTNLNRPAQDGVLNFYRQGKISGWGAPSRAASGLEARYIKAEADGDPAALLTLINERRAAGNLTPFDATTNMDVLMSELMEQKTRDFWLEAKRMGDYRRIPQYVPYWRPIGDTYYKPNVGSVGSQTCWPVPGTEIRNNPNWPK